MSHRRWAAVLTLIALATLLRGGVICARRAQLENDPDAYRAIAENLASYGVYGRDDPTRDPPVATTAYRPPLYPVVLSKLATDRQIQPVAVGLLHLTLGVATVGLTYWLGLRWGIGRWSFMAAALVALDPILLNQSSLVMTETLATFLAVVALLVLTHFGDNPTLWRAATAGVWLAMSSLCRPTSLVWLAATVPVVLWLRGGWLRRQGDSAVLDGLGRPSYSRWHQRFLRAAVVALAAAAVLAPWTIRNYREFGRLIVTTTHGGYTLLLGNNPQFYRHLREAPWGSVWDAAELEAPVAITNSSSGHDDASSDSSAPLEIQNDRLAYELAAQTIRDQPLTFAYACAVRVGWLWSPLPHQVQPNERAAVALMRYAIAVWYLLLFVLAAIGCYSLRWQLLRTPWIWGLLLCLTLTAVHTVYWSNLRMRAPLIPVVGLAAALGTSVALSWVRRRKRPSSNDLSTPVSS